MKKLNVGKIIVFAMFFIVAGCSKESKTDTSSADPNTTDTQPALSSSHPDAANTHTASELYATGKYREAFSAATKCATDAVCQDLLGRMYYFGNGVDEDEKKSLPWVKKAAASNNPYAKYLLAIYLEQGEVIEENAELAQQYYAEALKSLTALGMEGDAAALYFIGNMYDFGYGVEQNSKTARIWLEKSAEKNYVDAQLDLGYLYDEAEGGAEDNITAIKWYTKAALAGSPKAQYNLALVYDEGEAQVPADDLEAVKWYTMAAENGHASAMNNLAVMYEEGEGIPADLKKSYYWYKKAAESGNAKAEENLAEFIRDHGKQ